MSKASDAASALAKRRWANTTAAERQEFTAKLRKARARKTTKAQRSEIARLGGLALAKKRAAAKS